MANTLKLFVAFVLLLALVACASTPTVNPQCAGATNVSKDETVCPGTLKVTRTDKTTVCMSSEDAATMKAQCPQFQ